MKFLSSLAFAFSSGELTEQEAVAKPDTEDFAFGKEAFRLGTCRNIEKGTYKAGRDDIGAHFGRQRDGLEV